MHIRAYYCCCNSGKDVIQIGKVSGKGKSRKNGDRRETATQSQLLASGCLGRASGLGALATMGSERGSRLQTRVQEYLELLEMLKPGEGVGAVRGGAQACAWWGRDI